MSTIPAFILGAPQRDGTVPVRFGELVLHMTPLAARCTYNEMFRFKRLRDLTGQRFGRLVPIKRMSKDKEGHWLWLCRCDCGTECLKVGYSVSSGGTQSCGCLLRENCGKIGSSARGKHWKHKKARKAAA